MKPPPNTCNYFIELLFPRFSRHHNLLGRIVYVLFYVEQFATSSYSFLLAISVSRQRFFSTNTTGQLEAARTRQRRKTNKAARLPHCRSLYFGTIVNTGSPVLVATQRTKQQFIFLYTGKNVSVCKLDTASRTGANNDLRHLTS